jgi:hypothetical protein
MSVPVFSFLFSIFNDVFHIISIHFRDANGLVAHKANKIDAIVCVFKITRFETFEAVEAKYAQFASDIPIRILVGTHLDHEPSSHEVTYHAATKLAERQCMLIAYLFVLSLSHSHSPAMTYYELAANDSSSGGRMNIFVDIARSLKEKHNKSLESYLLKPEFGVQYGHTHHQRIAPCTIQ